MSVLESYNYKTYKYEPIPGTEDWVEVVEMGDGGYDWAELRAFYSPSARRYFWHGDSGCSCNGWSDEVANAADFENGDRENLLRALKQFAEEHTYNVGTQDLSEAIQEVKSFTEPVIS